MEVAVTEAVLRQLVEIGCLTKTTKGADLAVADVVQDDKYDVWGTLAGTDGLGPGGRRLLDGPPDDALELLGHGGTSWVVREVA